MIKNMKIHIPVSKFGFIEADGELQELLELHDRVANKPLEKNNGAFEKIKTFTEELVLYNDVTHVYNDMDGNPLISGSKFASKFGKPFPKAQIVPKMAAKHDTTPEYIEKMWADNSDMACTFGTAVHKGLENYFTYRGNGAYKKPKHPVLKNIIDTFPHTNLKEDCVPEAMVSCVKRKMVGQIDNLIWIDKKKKIVDIWDYKTAGALNKDDLYKYSIQINYYRATLEFMGYTVRKMLLQNWNGKWTEYKIKRMDLTKLGKKEIVL